MSTNFYWISKEAVQDSIQVHIGKRSAAGSYCFDCGTTLYDGGTVSIHTGDNNEVYGRWLGACPSCSKKASDTHSSKSNSIDTINNLSPFSSKSGISMSNSFTWTLLKHKWTILEMVKTNSSEKVIVNEYGEFFSAKEFFDELDACPIEHQLPVPFS